MNSRALIHLIIGGAITRTTRTGCNQMLEDCGTGTTYKFRDSVTCPACRRKIEAIMRLRGDSWRIPPGPAKA